MKKNKLSIHKTLAEKRAAFAVAQMNGDVAHCSDYSTIPLCDLSINDVEFVGGLWRVQNKFPYKIQMIRDREMVLLEKMSFQERIPFDYYTASLVGYNCYGPFMSGKPDYIVARYQTDNGIYWGYGKTIEKARAFLGIKLFDEHMDLIHKHACQNQLSHQKK